MNDSKVALEREQFDISDVFALLWKGDEYCKRNTYLTYNATIPELVFEKNHRKRFMDFVNDYKMFPKLNEMFSVFWKAENEWI